MPGRDRVAIENRFGSVEACQGQRPQASASGFGTDDQLIRLEKLGQLHASGVLTDAEFAAEKGKVLGSS